MNKPLMHDELPFGIRRKIKRDLSRVQQSNKVAVYARVSSKEQAKGYSIEAQLELLREYAVKKGFEVVREFVDVESAKQSGRKVFGEMITWLRGQDEVRMLLVEKIDRSTRNKKDWHEIEELVRELNFEIHLVKESRVFSQESGPMEIFLNDIGVASARLYINNLKAESLKGTQTKTNKGGWCHKAPIGYYNTVNREGKRIVAIDEEEAPFVKKLYEYYDTGQYNLKEVGKKIRADGLVYRKSNRPVPTSTCHAVLRNPFYIGFCERKGEIYKGEHEPIIDVKLWERVQDRMDGKNLHKPPRKKRGHAFAGFMLCDKCGYSIVGEIKKGRWVYYHCSNYKEKCKGKKGIKHIREEELEMMFSEIVGWIRFDDRFLECIKEDWGGSVAEERRKHSAAISRLQAECKHLQNRIDAAYDDKCDGKISDDYYERRSGGYREAQERCRNDIEQHEKAMRLCMKEFEKISELVEKFPSLFACQTAHEKRRLLNLILSKCVWKTITTEENGEEKESVVLEVEFKKPFDALMRTKTVVSINLCYDLPEKLLSKGKREEIEEREQAIVDALAKAPEYSRRAFLSDMSGVYGKDFDKIFRCEFRQAG